MIAVADALRGSTVLVDGWEGICSSGFATGAVLLAGWLILCWLYRRTIYFRP